MYSWIAPASWELWTAIGLVCVALDMLMGYSGSLVALGIAALLTAVAAAVGFVPTWTVACLVYAVLAAGCTIVARKLIPKPKGPDINEY